MSSIPLEILARPCMKFKGMIVPGNEREIEMQLYVGSS